MKPRSVTQALKCIGSAVRPKDKVLSLFDMFSFAIKRNLELVTCALHSFIV